jgi:orotate phosphoribosyltransferase
MTTAVFQVLPGRQGHFLLESGLHSNLWLGLDGLFLEASVIGPLVEALASRLRPYHVAGVCGPLVGGAFLAHALAAALSVSFFYSEYSQNEQAPGLFGARYRLPPSHERHISGKRVAVVDDVISAGSSVRATVSAVAAAGGATVAIGALMCLGDTGAAYFAQQAIPLEVLDRRPFNLWSPADCPLCRTGVALEDPRS